MPDIGIVIVTYNSEAVIGASLDAALRSGAEVVVVDNASGDGTVAEARRRNVRLIANASNRGFAAAANQGFRALETRYVLLLNPDAVIQTSLEPLRAACDLPGSAGAGGMMLGEDDRPQKGFMLRRLPTAAALICEALLLNRLWPGNPFNRRYRCLDCDIRLSMQAEQPAGAFLMIRREAWEELRGFDEGFFPLWFEDVDFCRRLADRAYTLYYTPEAVVKHTGAHSIVGLPVELGVVYWYGSLLRYSAKHFRPVAFRAVCAAVVTGSILRMIGGSARNGSLKVIAAYGRVVGFACRCGVFGWRDEAVPGSQVQK